MQAGLDWHLASTWCRQVKSLWQRIFSEWWKTACHAAEDAVGADDSSLQTPRRLSRVSEKDDAPAVEPLASGSEINSALGTRAEAAQDPRPAPEQPVLNNTFAFPAPEAVSSTTQNAYSVIVANSTASRLSLC